MLDLFISRARFQYMRAADNMLNVDVRAGAIVVLTYRTCLVSPTAVIQVGSQVRIHADDSSDECLYARDGELLHVALTEDRVHITVRLKDIKPELEVVDRPEGYFVQ